VVKASASQLPLPAPTITWVPERLAGPESGQPRADNDASPASYASTGTGRSAQKPPAERPGPLDERLVDGGRGQEGIDHEAELPAAVRGAENDAQEAGDAADVAE
jgi:hypothetical protein